ncbi:MAG: glycosyltransferase family 2 protein [Streptosporangiaceae bacterium]
MPDDLISFVVIAYNEAAGIGPTLDSIARLAGLGEYEIIVVNDGSRDGTGQLVAGLAQRDPRIRLIDLPANRGRGHARSTGIAAARGGLIATVDADILLPADWLDRTRTALAGHDAVGGTAVPDGDVGYVYRRFGLAPRVVGSTTTVTGNNGLYRRSVFDRVSFDAALREGEDSALNHAMACQGLSVATVPGLVVQHRETKTFGTSLRWLFETGEGATRQLLAYRQLRQPDLVTAAFAASLAAGLAAAATRRPLLGAAIPASFVLAASTQHVRTRFETPRPDWLKVAPAVAVDGAMLSAYFAGRLAGLGAAVRRAAGSPRHPASGAGTATAPR